MSDTSQGKGWWQAADGKWYAPQMTAMQINAPEPFMLTVGNIGVSQSWIVTPSGNVPIREASVTSIEQTATVQKIPTWAIVLTVIFIWVFLLSLLFLLVRETKTQGTIMVTITGPGVHHVTFVPVSDPMRAMAVKRDVDQIDALIQRAKL